jgi:hypothetical protein
MKLVKQPQRMFVRMKKAVLREDLMVLTKDLTQSMVLGQMLYWTKTLDKVNDWLFEENKRLAESDLAQHEYNYGWIWKSAREMREDLMCAFSEDAIQRAFNALTARGLLMKRNNPSLRYDRKLHYRVDLILLRRMLKDCGYMMTDFQLAPDVVEIDCCNSLNPIIPQYAECIPQGAESIPHSAETITETIVEITNKDTNPLPPSKGGTITGQSKSSLPPDRQKTTAEQPEGKVMSATAEQKETPRNDSPPLTQYSAEFETFWTSYPRKIGKQAAFREWKRCKVDLPTALKAIEQQRKAGMFKEQQFIIYPERWIKNGRWEEIETAPQLRVNAPVASSNPQAGSSCHRIKSEGLEDAFWNWFQTQRDWEERRNLRTVDDVWLDQFLLTLSEEF